MLQLRRARLALALAAALTALALESGAQTPPTDAASLVAGIGQITPVGNPSGLVDLEGGWAGIVGGDNDTLYPHAYVMAQESGAGRVVRGCEAVGSGSPR